MGSPSRCANQSAARRRGSRKHLDELRIDIQVIYPTTFIRTGFVGHEEVEVALTPSYNRWIAQRTAESQGWLRWVASYPF